MIIQMIIEAQMRRDDNTMIVEAQMRRDDR
jgi:hypothetical protein